MRTKCWEPLYKFHTDRLWQFASALKTDSLYLLHCHLILQCAGFPQNAPVCHVREAQNEILTHFSCFSLLLSLKYETWSISAESVPRVPSSSSASAALRYTHLHLAFSDPNRFWHLDRKLMAWFFTSRPLHHLIHFIPSDAGLDWFLQRLFLKLIFLPTAWGFQNIRNFWIVPIERQHLPMQLPFILTGMRVVMIVNWTPN